jgi:hypothetical protein
MMHDAGYMLNPKFQMLNPKQIKNSNVKCSKQAVGAAFSRECIAYGFRFEFWSFKFVCF